MQTEIIFYGHAALGVNVGPHRLIVDPYFTGNSMAKVKSTEIVADYLLITHGHGDHVGDAVEIAKRCDATCIANAEICRWLSAKGIKTHAQHIGGGFTYPFGYLKLTNALHGSLLPDGSNGGNPAGFLLTTPDGQKIYMAGDTGLFSDMRLIGEEGITAALIPIGDNYTMGPADALRAVKLLAPQVVIPIHYDTFPLIRQDVGAWKRQVEQETTAKVVILAPGEKYQLNA